ncbi:MAG: AAA family ATPase [Nanoarchaeota archaeon]|nr:AAA family ATPase [Nanoarchaeota archaeon]
MKDPLGMMNLEPGVLTTVYGPSGTGKTNYCLLAAQSLSGQRKTVFIDTENGVSADRLRQLGRIDMSLLRPRSFQELQRQLTMLYRQTPRMGMLALDSVAMLYRLELAGTKDPAAVNRAMALQLGLVWKIARKAKIPALLTDHVYSPFSKEEVLPVGGDLISYSSKCLLELSKDTDSRVATLRKHRSLKEGLTKRFVITQTGFQLG